MKAIVLLSGEIATGKTALAQVLISRHQFKRVGTGTYLQQVARDRGIEIGRDTLKELGDSLDTETTGKWVADIFQEQSKNAEEGLWLLDSIRRDFQIPWFRESFVGTVLHAHLTAPDEILKQRYEVRKNSGGEYDPSTSYEQAKTGPTEQQVKSLGPLADLKLDTGALGPEELAEKIVEALLYRGTK
jgi:cytidylate kinase